MNEHLIVEVNETLNFKKVTCKEGHYITNWDKVDIMQYTSAKVMYCPMGTDLESYYCITEEAHNILMEEMEKKAKEEEEKRNNR